MVLPPGGKHGLQTATGAPRTAVAHSEICGRTVRPWMPFGLLLTELSAWPCDGFLCIRGAVGWVSQQVAPSSHRIFLWSEFTVAWFRPL